MDYMIEFGMSDDDYEALCEFSRGEDEYYFWIEVEEAERPAG